MSMKFPAFTLATLAGLSLLGFAGNTVAQVAYPTASASVQPVNDPFYVSPTAYALAAKQPGAVLRYRAIPNTTYSARVSQAYQLMFRSTDGRGMPTAAVTTLLIPKTAPASARKLLSFQAMYDSLQLNCTPSNLTVNGKLFEKGYVNKALDAGVLVVLTDYEGLQSQWVAGMNTAHGVLDGIRAAQKFSKSGLNSSSPVGLMGYSGGGHATAWANEVQPEYAPEMNLVGVAMGGLPVNPKHAAEKADGGPFAAMYFGAVVGMSRAYPELNLMDYVTADGAAMIKDISRRCLMGTVEGQPEMLTPYMFKKGSKYWKSPDFLNLPEIKRIIDENTMGSRMPKAPMYIYEGVLDEVMPIADVDALVKRYCAAGLSVEYNRVAIGDHLVLAISPGKGMDFVLDRLNGKAAPSNCQ